MASTVVVVVATAVVGVEVAPRLPRVRGTAGSLAQLLLTLLLNAVQAMPTESPARAPRVVLRAEALQVGGRALVALRVSDNGLALEIGRAHV